MKHTKANFRVIRERVGLSQQAVATALGNQVMTVKRWENPKYPVPPNDAWEMLEGALKVHMEAVDTTVENARRRIAEIGQKPESFDLAYYRSQAQYDVLGRDSGDYQIVNARSREIGVRLEQLGIPVEFHYPETV